MSAGNPTPVPRRSARAWLVVLAVALPGFFGARAYAALSSQSLALSERQESLVKLGLCIAVTALVAFLQRRAPRPLPRRAGALLIAAATLCIAAYTNFGMFHGRSFVHHWDQFHYQLGAKYFPELGYDGLYVASIGAQADLSPTGKMQTWVRDLRSYEVEHVRTLIPHMQEVYARFTPERWAAFSADNRFFAETSSFEQMGQIRRDHGFNGTPAWTFVARLFVPWLPASEGSLTLLALLDVALLLGAYLAVFRSFGARIGCLSLILLGVGYAGRFSWLGGTFLRFDWLAALLFGLCALERARFATAGACLGYATLVRLFPALFLFGPGVLALRALLRGERPRWALRLGVGFTSALLLGVLAGSTTGRGFHAWSEFASAIEMHANEFLTNNVGLSNLLVYDRAILERRDVDWDLPEPWIRAQQKIRERKAALALPILATRTAFLLLLAAGVWRASLTEAAVAGMVAVFSVATLTGYYWVLLLIAPLGRNPVALYGVLLLNAGLWLVDLYVPGFEGRYGFMSWGLALLFLAWLLPAGLRSLRAARDASPPRSRPAPRLHTTG